jgi:cytoskeleton protein RodZ
VAAASGASLATGTTAGLTASNTLSAASNPIAAAAPAEGILVLTATTESWVGVTNKNGKQLLGRTLAAGESVGFSEGLPFTVRVGNVAGIQVQVRGQAFDLKDLNKDNVARFEVK